MRKTLFLWIALLTSMLAFAQNPHASLKKITQNDIEFYLYEVAESEGLFRISQNFQISQEEIMQFNPQAVSGLQKGMTLRIPTSSAKKTNNADLVIHTVKKGETVYSITRHYSIDEKTLLDWNPEIANGLKEGDTLKIPLVSAPAPKINMEQTTPPATNAVEHTVEAQETLYSLSKKYNVSAEDIVKNNPEAAEGLKIGQTIKIPNNQAKAVAETPAAPVNTLVTKPLEHSVKVALLLPFMLDTAQKQDATIDKFIEFYEGFLLGVNKLKEERISIELFTYDIEKSDAKLREVLVNNPEIRNADLIFGPVYTAQLPIINSFTQQYKVHTIIPFAPKVETIGTNPYLFQNNAPTNMQTALMVNSFIKQFSNKNIVLVNVAKDKNDKGAEFLKLLKHQLNYLKINFREITVNDDYADLTRVLTPNQEIITVVGTENATLAKGILTAIEAANTQKTISILGFSEWENIIPTASSVYYFSPFYIDKDNKNIIAHRALFQQEFGKASSQIPNFDLMGYDLSTYFIKAVYLHGKKFPDKLSSYKQEKPLQSRFNFTKQEKGGYINTTMQLIHSSDFGKTIKIIE